MAIFKPLFEALESGRVRYVVVGGLATVLHGFARLTADVDLVVDLTPVEALRAVDVLVSLGLRARAPVDPRGFADEKLRREWIATKGMRVFSFWDPKDPMREVDLFVEHPIPFEELWERSELVPVGPLRVRVASIPDLIRLKELAGRPEDRIDIEALRAILERREKKA